VIGESRVRHQAREVGNKQTLSSFSCVSGIPFSDIAELMDILLHYSDDRWNMKGMKYEIPLAGLASNC